MLLATKIILVITILGDIALLTLILKEQKSILRTLFAIFITAVIGWAATILLNVWFKSPVIEEWIFAFATIFLVSQVWFVKLFPEGKMPTHRSEYWSLIVGGMFLVVSFWDGALFHSITVHDQGYTILSNGPLMTAYSVFSLMFVVMPIILLLGKRRYISSLVHRTQLQYLTVGFSVFLFVNILTNMFLPVFLGIYFFNAIGPVFSLFLSAAVFYIIWYHQFLNIRIVIQRGFTYTILLAFLVGMYIATLFVFNSLTPLQGTLATQLSAVSVMLVGIFTVPTLKRFFRKSTDRFFFKDRYEYSDAIQELSNILNTYNTPEPLVRETLVTLKKIFRIQSSEFLGSDAQITEMGLVRVPVVSKGESLEHVSKPCTTINSNGLVALSYGYTSV